MTMKLKSKTLCPPNGFMFVCKATGYQSWVVDAQTQWNWNLLVQRVTEHFKSNPGLGLPTDPKQIEEMIDVQNALRVAKIPGAEIYLLQTQDPPKARAPYQSQGGVFQNVAASVKNIQAGRRTLSDWWGEGGKPVPQAEADARASICAICPQNDSGGLLAKFTIEAAKHIREDLEELNNQKLVTPIDEKLGDHVCKACDCPLRLKVWTPLAHIIRHMPDDTKAKLDPNCWIL